MLGRPGSPQSGVEEGCAPLGRGLEAFCFMSCTGRASLGAIDRKPARTAESNLIFRVSCNQRGSRMGLSIPLPRTGHLTCYRTGQVIYYRHPPGPRLTKGILKHRVLDRNDQYGSAIMPEYLDASPRCYCRIDCCGPIVCTKERRYCNAKPPNSKGVTSK